MNDLVKETIDPQLEAYAQQHFAALVEPHGFIPCAELPLLFARNTAAAGASQLVALRFGEYRGKHWVVLTHGLGQPPDVETDLYPGQLAYQRIAHPPCGVESAQYNFEQAEDLGEIISGKVKSRFEKRALPWFRKNTTIPMPPCPGWLREGADAAACFCKESAEEQTQFSIYLLRKTESGEYLNAEEFDRGVIQFAFPDRAIQLRGDIWKVETADQAHGGELRIHSHEPMDHHYDPIFDVVAVSAHLTSEVAAHFERAVEANPWIVPMRPA